MDTHEANELLASALTRYRAMAYGELQRLLNTQNTFEVAGMAGAKYQVEVEAVWDDQPGGNIRVMAHIDDGGWRAFVPLTADFILAPSGRFVDE